MFQLSPLYQSCVFLFFLNVHLVLVYTGYGTTQIKFEEYCNYNNQLGQKDFRYKSEILCTIFCFFSSKVQQDAIVILFPDKTSLFQHQRHQFNLVCVDKQKNHILPEVGRVIFTPHSIFFFAYQHSSLPVPEILSFDGRSLLITCDIHITVKWHLQQTSTTPDEAKRTMFCQFHGPCSKKDEKQQERMIDIPLLYQVLVSFLISCLRVLVGGSVFNGIFWSTMLWSGLKYPLETVSFPKSKIDGQVLACYSYSLMCSIHHRIDVAGNASRRKRDGAKAQGEERFRDTFGKGPLEDKITLADC